VAHAQEWLDQVDDHLFLQTRNGAVRADLHGLLDLEGYFAGTPAPALLFQDDEWFFNPRLSLFLDLQLGPHFYSSVQFRLDRGFDPGAKPDGDARFDEYFLRWTPFDDRRFNLQAGKFATVVGNWVPRHLSWDNPLINAPLPYENIAIITDQSAPATPAAFLARRHTPDRKALWVPALWGPVYAAGASAFGTVERFDYAFEVKNAAVSSRPAAWDPLETGWEHPTVSGRLGFRPRPDWNLGVSASAGSYLLDAARPTLPAGSGLGDFEQSTIGFDAAYAWHHWQVWGEVFLSRFDVPTVGHADSVAYYVEAKYKITSQLFAAARWNQQFFGDVSDGTGGETRWDKDIWRIDAGLGYRFTRHLQAKVQYSYNRESGPAPNGNNLVAAQFTVKF
jgi:hypothetical protein